ncbi:p-hydroxycinnamoyl CoA hydratase/lyase [Microbacterium pseudoresistens]|uniref:Trans-feruloyl-CoA hydratase/vanillin synthase n=1 Tax=Microbacterium pseudoresistens TaxID=640634 RepID=A0A7Y9EVT8_9MICO|nr:enoyl-CoA hydratase-related protein [Microbacterium pseudoresistens]NYD54885.1 trans-feruloyl-CoA hydratase/vanillin synthase [Microbacterium pseudoresistens]
MSNYETIRVDRDDALTTVTLSRPEKKNAMNPQLHEEMHDFLSRQLHDKKTKALVITGAGDAFSAGMDLKEHFADLASDIDELNRVRYLSQDWRGRLLPLQPAVTIARVNGFCFGGAFPIVLGCDLAIAADEAKFGLSEINFGQVAGGPVSKMLGDVLHPRDVMYHLLTGEPFYGPRAAEIKLVNSSVPGADLDDAVAVLVASLLEKKRETLALAKRLYRNSIHMQREGAFAYANATVAELSQATKGEWLEKGVGGFISKEFKPGENAYRAS